jgi:hypothetical protein
LEIETESIWPIEPGDIDTILMPWDNIESCGDEYKDDEYDTIAEVHDVIS